MKLRNLLPAVALVSLGATGAMAKTQMNFDTRVDYVNTDNDIKSTGTADVTKFTVNRIRLKIWTDVTDNTKFLTRLRLEKTAGSSDSIDGTNRSYIEYAYFQTAWTDKVTTVVGKFAALVGGWENDYSGSDVYEYSLVPLYLPAYEGSLSANYMINKDHNVWAQYLNTDAGSGATSGQRNHAWGVAWYGNFMDGMVKTIWNYHHFRHGNPSGSGQFATQGSTPAANAAYEEIFYTLGFQFNHSMFSLDVDWHNYDQKDGGIQGLGSDVEMSGIAARLLYNAGHFRPYIKYTTSSYDDETADTNAAAVASSSALEYDYDTYTVALQYYPKKDVNFRYHLAYTSADTDYKRLGGASTLKDKTVSNIYLGIKASIDLL